MLIIANKYQIIERFGKGQFSTVCRGNCLKTQKQVAIKMEHEGSPYPLLKHEANILHYLSRQKCKYIPQVYYYGFQYPYTCLVLSFYGQGSLEEWSQHLAVDEICEWWNTALDILEHVHKQGIVHRDLKPAHFMRDNQHDWHLIDFGLATTYLNQSQEHIEEHLKEHIVGSPNYVSYYVHYGKEVVRRDDFLSLIYILWELLYGTFFDTDNITTVVKPTGSTHIQDEYNLWLREQKKFERLYSILKTKTGIMVNGVLSALAHVETLRFTDKPNYTLFTVEIEDGHDQETD